MEDLQLTLSGEDRRVTVVIKCSLKTYNAFVRDGIKKFDEEMNEKVGPHTYPRLTFSSTFKESLSDYEVDYWFKSLLSKAQHPDLWSIAKKFMNSFLKKYLDDDEVKITFHHDDTVNGMTIRITQQGLVGTLTVTFDGDSCPTSLSSFTQDFNTALSWAFQNSRSKKRQMRRDLHFHITVKIQERKAFDKMKKMEKGVQQVKVEYKYPRADLSYQDMDECLEEKIRTSVEEEAKTILKSLAKSTL